MFAVIWSSTNFKIAFEKSKFLPVGGRQHNQFVLSFFSIKIRPKSKKVLARKDYDTSRARPWLDPLLFKTQFYLFSVIGRENLVVMTILEFFVAFFWHFNEVLREIDLE